MVEKYPHLVLHRERIESDRRRRRAPPPPDLQRNQQQHAVALATASDSVVRHVKSQRRHAGIDSDRLMVVELQSWNSGARDHLERLGAQVVEERLINVWSEKKDDKITRVLAQFETPAAIEKFRSEIKLYGCSSPKKSDLPPSARKLLFDAIETIREVTAEDRKGQRLKAEGWPESKSFALDVDLWHPGTSAGALEILAVLRSMCDRYGARVVDDAKTSTLLLVRVEGSHPFAEALLELDFVARVDLPPRLAEVYSNLFHPIFPLPIMDLPTDRDPLVAVIDSGVLPGHPLLQGWVVEEYDFGSGEETPVDQHGHGTQVAGLVVYGDVAACLEARQWKPRIRIW